MYTKYGSTHENPEETRPKIAIMTANSKSQSWSREREWVR